MKAKKKHRKPGSTVKKIVAIVFIAMLLIMLLIAFVGCWITNSMLSSKPVEFKLIPPDMNAFMSVREKLVPLHGVIMQSKPKDTYQITLTSAEVNVILGNIQAIGPMLGAKINWPAGLNVKYENGWFNTEYSYEVPFNTPFGSYLNIYACIKPEMQEGIIDFELDKVKVGEMPAPAEMVADIANDILGKNKKALQTFTDFVADFYVDSDNNVKVKIYPYQIKIYIRKQLQD